MSERPATTSVVHLSPALYGDDGRLAGGGERYAFELARHMAEMAPTRLVSFGPKSTRQRIGALDVRVYGGDWRSRSGAVDPLPLRVLAREVRGASVLHCHQRNYRVSKVAGAMAGATGRRTYVTDHGGGHWGPGVWMPDRWSFDRHLFVSAFSRRVNPPPARIGSEVIYGGVDHHRFRPGAPRGTSFLYVGRLLPHKGVDVLIEALPEGAGLDVAGAVLDERYLRDLKVLAAGRSVRFHHDWDDQHIAEAYRRARAVIMPSVYVDRYGKRSAVPELLGQVLLEAMSSGTPVVCSDVGGMPEVVVHDRTGFVVPAGDPRALRQALTRFGEDDALVERMGDAARERVLRRFTWEGVARACVSAYGA